MSTAIESAEIRSLGQESGFNGPNTLFPSILATVLLCGILTTSFTAARLITKRLIITYEIEDYFLLLAWGVNLAYAMLLLVAGLDGVGHHVWDFTATELPSLSKLQQISWVLEIIYIPAIWLAKTSLLFQLIHIFTPMKSGIVYWACHTLIWGNLAFYVTIVFIVIFECHPIDEVWNPETFDSSNNCINRNAVLVATSAVNVFSDLMILLLPIWATWRLQMGLKRKIGIAAVFTTGILAFVSSICRLIYAIRVDTPIRADTSFIVAQVGMWALAEVTSVILCICFPMMPRLVKLISDRRAKSKSHLTPPLEHVTDESPNEGNVPGSGTARQIIRDHTSAPSIETTRSGDVELAMWSPVDPQHVGDSPEQQLNIDTAPPSISHP